MNSWQEMGPISPTALKQWLKSPNHFIAYKLGQRQESEAMDLGSLIHAYALTPDEADQAYMCIDETMILAQLSDSGNPRGTKKYKEWKAEQLDLALSTGKRIVSVEDLNTAKMLATKLRTTFDWLFDQDTEYEVHVEGTIAGMPVHGYVDMLRGHVLGDTVIDLKTTGYASLEKFKRDFFNYGYHIQLGMYCEILNTNHCQVLVAETDSPHGVGLYLVDEEVIQHSRDIVKNTIEDMWSWDFSNTSYDGTITLPKWLKK